MLTRNFIVTALDTSVGETGNTQTMEIGYLKKDIPMRFSVSLGSGDTVVVEGKADTDDDFETLYTFVDETPVDIYLSHIWRVRRTTDGGVGNTVIKIQNIFNYPLEAHE